MAKTIKPKVHKAKQQKKEEKAQSVETKPTVYPVEQVPTPMQPINLT